MTRTCLLACVLLATACGDKLPPFHCATNDQCDNGGIPGACVGGSCASPSTSCPSGWVYQDNAGTMAGGCVEGDAGIIPPDADAGEDMATAPTCSDAVRNGDETDIDCGGSCVQKCALGKGCLSGADCQSTICNAVTHTCVDSPCSDGKQDGQETDIDCGGGGGCPACAVGQVCGVPADCTSMQCVSNKCAAPATCSDGTQNGTETDVDCGGGACAGCAAGKKCNSKNDCAMGRQCLGAQCNNVEKACAGERHTCALLSDGTVKCWGWNQWGQVGNKAKGTNQPSPVVVLSGATDLRCNGASDDTCALVGGGLKCWGHNGYYELGDGTTNDRAAPPASPLLTGVGAFTVGGEVACAAQTGSLQCWGANYYGSAGNGSANTGGGNPVSTPSGTAILSGVSDVQAGTGHVCAIQNVAGNLSGGPLYCWGDNAGGELGYATPSANKSTRPMQVGNGTTWVNLCTGSAFTCATVFDGTIYCWGSDSFGQQGTSAMIGDSNPSPTRVASSAKAVYCGESHTCGVFLDTVTTVAGLKCWGRNDFGQLGDNKSEAQLGVPPSGFILANVKQVAAGQYHTCAVLNDGNMECWGSNAEGQLGLGSGSASEKDTPTPVLW